MKYLFNEKENIGNDTDQPIYNINYQYYKYSSLLISKFYRLVLDKAYKIRNLYTKTAEAIRRLEIRKKYLITAISIFNRGVDFFNYLTIF
jgi:SNF2 family DNA or RNA helicase